MHEKKQPTYDEMDYSVAGFCEEEELEGTVLGMFNAIMMGLMCLMQWKSFLKSPGALSSIACVQTIPKAKVQYAQHCPTLSIV